MTELNWATSWENLFMPYANNKGADQPAHMRSLISAFVVCCLYSIISLVSITEISSLYLASVAAQASLCLTWSKTPKTGFLMMRLNYCNDPECWTTRTNYCKYCNFLLCQTIKCEKKKNKELFSFELVHMQKKKKKIICEWYCLNLHCCFVKLFLYVIYIKLKGKLRQLIMSTVRYWQK